MKLGIVKCKARGLLCDVSKRKKKKDIQGGFSAQLYTPHTDHRRIPINTTTMTISRAEPHSTLGEWPK